MERTVLGIFEPTTNTEHLINDLQAEGYNPKDISIVMRDSDEAAAMRDDTGTSAVGETVEGAATGAVVGGLVGLLGAIALPGIGAILVGGPVATALGLTGIAATAASGAVTGALAGGLIGALMGLGLTRDEAEHYQERIREGAILVAVPTDSDGAGEVESLFNDYRAMEVKTLVHDRREYRRTTDEHKSAHFGFATKGGHSRRTRK